MARVNTTRGEMNEEDLRQVTGTTPEGVRFVEYYLGEELVHRSVTAEVTGVQGNGKEGGFGDTE